MELARRFHLRTLSQKAKWLSFPSSLFSFLAAAVLNIFHWISTQQFA